MKITDQQNNADFKIKKANKKNHKNMIQSHSGQILNAQKLYCILQ